MSITVPNLKHSFIFLVPDPVPFLDPVPNFWVFYMPYQTVLGKYAVVYACTHFFNIFEFLKSRNRKI